MSRSILRLLPVLLLILCQAAAPLPAAGLIPPTGAEVAGPFVETSLPSLASFVEQVKTGMATRVTGLYAAEVFAFPVVQQPAGQPAFVSLMDNTITQFGMASSHGSLGFVAHNTLAGTSFSDIQLFQLITVVYGDGHYTTYQVMNIRRFQATLPTSPYSSFVDLETKKTLSAAELFAQTYGIKDTLVLQTCLASNGNDNWGRLFIIALPYIPEPANYR